MIDWNKVISFASNGNPEPERKVGRSDEEWKEILGDEEFYVLRRKGTERAFTGEYCESHSPGMYHCRACDNPLFDSGIKYDSRSGWPSFTQPVAVNSISYLKDSSHGMTRVEVQCAVCDSHLGHVFPDGPAPSGLRYCINSVSIKLAGAN